MIEITKITEITVNKTKIIIKYCFQPYNKSAKNKSVDFLIFL